MNKIGLNVNDKVLVNGTNEGIVIMVSPDSALVELTIKINEKPRLVRQWYSNGVLKKITVEKIDTIDTGNTPEVEFGIVDADTVATGVKKTNRRKQNESK